MLFFLAAVTPNLSFSCTKSSQPNLKNSRRNSDCIFYLYFCCAFEALKPKMTFYFLGEIKRKGVLRVAQT